MPCGASAGASDWLGGLRPALLAPEAGELGSPRNAPRDDTLMIRPPRPFICCTAHHVTLAAPIRWTPSVACHGCCHCWYDTSSIGCGGNTPALLTRMSSAAGTP